MSVAKEILEAALKLPPEERVELAAELYESVEQERGIELSPEWEEEIQRRIREVDAGRMKTIPGEQVMAELRQRFGAR